MGDDSSPVWGEVALCLRAALRQSCLRGAKRQPGAHPALSLSLPAVQDTRRSKDSPRDPSPIDQATGEGVEPPPCRECLSGLGSVPQHCSSSRAAEARLLTFFHSFPLAQWRTFSARSLERLMEGQAEVRMAAFHLPLAVPGCQGGAASGVSLCRREGGRVPRCHSGSGEGWGASRNAGTSSLAALGGNLPRGAESPRGQRLPALPRSGCRCRLAARRWPFLLRGCSLSAAWFLQDDPKPGPPTAPSSNGGGLCRSPGEFWRERQRPATG